MVQRFYWPHTLELHFPGGTAAGFPGLPLVRLSQRRRQTWGSAEGPAESCWNEALTRRVSHRTQARSSGRETWLGAAEAPGWSRWLKGSVHAEASAHSAALCCRRPGALVVGSTTLLRSAGLQHNLGYFSASSPGFFSSDNLVLPKRRWANFACTASACVFLLVVCVETGSCQAWYLYPVITAAVSGALCVLGANNVNVTVQYSWALVVGWCQVKLLLQCISLWADV